MPEIHFTLHAQTGKMEMQVEGIQGASCAEVSKLVKELLGPPTQEENTGEFYVQAQIRPQMQRHKLPVPCLVARDSSW